MLWLLWSTVGGVVGHPIDRCIARIPITSNSHIHFLKERMLQDQFSWQTFTLNNSRLLGLGEKQARQCPHNFISSTACDTFIINTLHYIWAPAIGDRGKCIISRCRGYNWRWGWHSVRGVRWERVWWSRQRWLNKYYNLIKTLPFMHKENWPYFLLRFAWSS